LVKKLFEPVDNSPLIVFRILFGLLLFLESVGAIFTGWVKEVLIDPTFTFSFMGFEWLQPLPGYGMYFYYAAMGGAALLILLGYYYRFGAALFMVLWSGVYLMQKASYNNHYYLLILLCFWMLLVPANAAVSLDARRNPGIRTSVCPRWCHLVFIAQIGIVYFFATAAKINPDWLQLKPITIWFAHKTDYPIIGAFFATDASKWLVAYGGITFDFFIVPLLLWRKTRIPAFIVSIFFHLFNAVTFQIGIFPFLMIGISVFFFPGEQVRKLFFRNRPVEPQKVSYQGGTKEKIMLGILVTYFAVQIFLPLRHWGIKGDVNWTEEGHRMAWRMMLRTKSGSVYFNIKNADTGISWRVYPKEHLTPDQVSKMGKSPDVMWQYVQFLKKHYAQEGIPHIEVYAVSSVGLNGGARKPLVEPTVDLAQVPWNTFSHNEWVKLYED